MIKRHRPKDRNGVVKERGVRYIVRDIISPFSIPLSQRTPRVVGGEAGRWKGTSGETKKIALRQKGRKAGSSGKMVKSLNKNKGEGPNGRGRGKMKEEVVLVEGVKGGREELVGAST